MRVIQVTDYGSPHPGSFVPMLSAALDITRDQGWDARAVLPARARGRDWLPAFKAEYGSELLFAPQGGRLALARWLTDVVQSLPGPTLLHAHWTEFDLAVAWLAKRRPDVRALWHVHTVLSDSVRAQVRNRVRFALASRYVERMLCVAPHLAAELRERGAPEEKIEYFPNGIDMRHFPSIVTASERASARAAFGIDPSATVLLHFCRDWHLKGGDLFLDTFELLDQDSVAFMVRGGDIAIRELERRGLVGRVKVLDVQAEVRPLHAIADVLLATSRGEGMPFAVLEALASGVAVVATDIPGHAFLEGTPPGLRIAPLRSTAIAQETREVLARDPGRIRDEGEAARSWVQDRFGLAAWKRRLLALYEDVTEDWAAPGARDSARPHG